MAISALEAPLNLYSAFGILPQLSLCTDVPVLTQAEGNISGSGLVRLRFLTDDDRESTCSILVLTSSIHNF